MFEDGRKGLVTARGSVGLIMADEFPIDALLEWLVDTLCTRLCCEPRVPSLTSLGDPSSS
jgi:hypothetical protein